MNGLSAKGYVSYVDILDGPPAVVDDVDGTSFSVPREPHAVEITIRLTGVASQAFIDAVKASPVRIAVMGPMTNDDQVGKAHVDFTTAAWREQAALAAFETLCDSVPEKLVEVAALLVEVDLGTQTRELVRERLRGLIEGGGCDERSGSNL